MTRRPLAPLAILLFVALPLSAWAAPKVAVTAIDGDNESEVRDAVMEAIDGDDFKLISKKETNKAVDRIGELSDLTEKDAKKLAKDLSADAIIHGSLEKDGGNKTLKIKVFANGKMKKGFSIKFKKASSPKFKEAVRKKVVEKLDGLTETAAAEDKPKKGGKAEPDDEDPLPKPKKGEKPEKAEKAEQPAKGGKNGKGEKAEKAEKAEKPEKPAKAEKAEKPAKAEKPEKAAAGDGDEDDRGEKSAGEGEGDEGEKAAGEGDGEEGAKAAPKQTGSLEEGDEDDDELAIRKRRAAKRSGRSANRASARVDVGPSVVKRSVVFNSNLPVNLAPRAFRPDPVPGLRVEGELYPIGFGNPDSFIAGLGLAFKYDRTVKFSVRTTAEENVEVPVDQFRYAIGARFRLVGKSPTSPSVTIGADLGRSRFRPNRKVLMDPSSVSVPDTYYKFIAPGLGIRIPLGGVLAFFARGEGWLVSDAGMIVRSYSYGKAQVLGFDSEGGLDILPVQRFAIRLSGGFTSVGYKFTGRGGELANGKDGDPTTLDVGGAADRSIHASVTLAVTY